MSRKKLKTDSSIAGLRRLAAAIARSITARSSSLTGCAGREISPINREAGDRFAHSAAQRIEGEIAIPAILLRKPIEHVAEDIDVVGERQPHDEALLRVNQMAEMHRVADEPVEGLRDRCSADAIDEQRCAT